MKTAKSADGRFVELDDFIEREYVASGRLAGAQLGILSSGTLHTRSFGYLDRSRVRPMPNDAIFRIFSMTKPITSVAFMMLVEEGRIGLRDPVARYIPEWSQLAVSGSGPVGQEMRIVHLLSHTSGLTYGVQYRTDIDASYRKALSMQPDGQPLTEFIAALAGLPLEFEPGSAWNYSVATDVLPYIIEQVSGQSFHAFLQQRIFDPLEMVDTNFSVSAAQRNRLAECYVRREEEPLSLPNPAFDNGRTGDPTFVSGGGGLVSTMKDYMSFCRLILDGGRVGDIRLLERRTLDLMSTNHVPMGRDLKSAAQGLFADDDYAGIGFGLGWATTIDPAIARLPGSRGDAFWSGMANTFFWCDPHRELACIFMTQLLPSEAYPLQRQIKTRVYEAIGRTTA